ncbi:Retrovirus-related Pol polyprotein from transposon TNT 1-94 [Triticum urartu]|uniref:U-box domain-containing protein n=1 Tax=Triticum urartu TaxID=4572 RepID=M7ZB77_TRIUA|nr:Retrovirus-related Pol polyprotein from transposon TNT 1-94 [Triticum urartu]
METSGGGTAQHHFVCPISLQPMQDPVTAPTGISYDRRAIERWLANGHATCPVTGRQLSLTDLTPNHTLRRLILSWHPASKVAPDVAPTLEPDDPEVVVLVAKVMSPTSCPTADVLCEAAASAAVSITARRCMVRAGVQWRVLRLFSSCGKTSSRAVMPTVQACLALLDALDVSADELRPLLSGNHDLVDALTHVLVMLENGTYSGGGGNTTRDSAAGAAHEAIELELSSWPSSPSAGKSRRVTELVMALLARLCSCAEGRAAVVAHPAGIALVAKRALRVSAATDTTSPHQHPRDLKPVLDAQPSSYCTGASIPSPLPQPDAAAGDQHPQAGLASLLLMSPSSLFPLLVLTQEAKPTKMEADDWEELQLKAARTIRLFLSDQVIYHVMDENSPKKIWEKLESQFMSKTAMTKVYLKQKLHGMRIQEGSDLVEYMNAFNQVVTDLARLGATVDDEDMAILLLCSLPSSYDHLITTLTHGKETIKNEDITAALLSYDMRKKNAVEVSHGEGLLVKGLFDRDHLHPTPPKD